jgi:predicted deacylase
MRDVFKIGGISIKPGEKSSVDFRVPDLYTHTGITMPVSVIHGKKPGPVLFISAAIHGDEINGVEIIRRVLHSKKIKYLRGTLVAVPVVNIYGFINKTRYLPDRRDLNRSFPGSDKGSLAGRMADIFLQEIVSRCDYGIDLHTAAIHRDNLPQVRAVLDDPETERIARAFSVPVILNTNIVEGTLRQSVEEMDIPVVVYEAGEALRFNEVAIRAGFEGVISVMRELGMLRKQVRRKAKPEPLVAKSSTWVRASQSGLLRAIAPLGASVKKDEVLGIISDPFGEKEENVFASARGIIIGKTNIPLVNEGEALFHIARFETKDNAAEQVEEFLHEMNPATDQTPAGEIPIV